MFSRVLFTVRSKSALRGVLLFFPLLALIAAPLAIAKSHGKSGDRGHNGQGNNNQGNHGRGHDQTRLASRYAKQEIQIIKKMIDQRQAAIELALLGDLGTTGTAVAALTTVTTGTTSADGTTTVTTVTVAAINAWCKAYAAREQAELTQLQTWLQTWFKVAYTPKTGGAGDGDDDELTTLTGVAFLDELLDHLNGVHMRGVALSKQAIRHGYEPELLAFAAKSISADLTDVVQLRTLLQLIEPPHNHGGNGGHEGNGNHGNSGSHHGSNNSRH